MASAFKLRIVSAAHDKPPTLELRADQSPPSLRAHRRWVGWHWLWRVDKAGRGKWTKPPLCPRGGHARSNDPATWGSYEEALAMVGRGDADGIGFMLGDGWCGADFDDCRDPETGRFLGDVEAWVRKFPSYAEVSATGTGIKVIGRGTKPRGFCRKGNIEVYDRGRYFALTGWRLDASPAEVGDITGTLAELHAAMSERPKSAFRQTATNDDRMTDDEVLDKARSAANGDKFTRLWAGDTSGHQADGNDGRSEADLALCSILAFWCGNDYAQVDRLFRRSGLMRPKWDERHRHDGASYGRMTVEKAITGEVYRHGEPRADRVTAARDESADWVATLDGEIIAEGTPDDFAALRKSSGRSRQRIFEVLTIGELMAKEFPPPSWCIPGLLAEGLNLLVGSPKMGKSFLSLNLGMTVAAGGHALGDIRTVPGDVLYLSLEDQQRRVRARSIEMAKVIGRGAEKRLAVATDWPRMDQGGLGLIENWIGRVAVPRLVIIDVLGRFRPMIREKGNAYEQDSQHMYAIKELADEAKVTMLVVHHTRKAKGKKDEADDEMESISGTQGLAGGADGIVLLHRMRHSNLATISVTGRDHPEQKLAIEFDATTLTWKSLGTAEEHIQGKLQNAVVRFLKHRPGSPVFVGDIVSGINADSTAQIETNGDKVRVTLHRLADKGMVQKRGNAWVYPAEPRPEQNDTANF